MASAGADDTAGAIRYTFPVMKSLKKPRVQAAEHHEILWPEEQSAPLVLASPHSGAAYPADFVASSPLDPLDLRRSEDCFVDELYLGAQALGVPLLRAMFPRAFIDANREPFELDQEMFEDELPPYVNVNSTRVAAGLGTIARVVASGKEIYGGKLPFTEALRRIETRYRPYHAALRGLIDATRDRFGYCILIDCHSMPSVGAPMDPDAGRGRADFILGDGFGTTCESAIAETVERTLEGHGYRVTRNKPFAGGHTTRHYGRPVEGVHALQIETNRALYMDEDAIGRLPALAEVAGHMTSVVSALIRLSRVDLAAE